MKKIKIAFWIVLLAFLGLIVYQNRELFLDNQTLSADLLFTQYQSPGLPLVIFFAVIFILGWLIAFTFGWLERYKAGKTIKKLRETIQSQQSAIDSMKKDIEALKPVPAAPIDPLPVNTLETYEVEPTTGSPDAEYPLTKE